mmetsp:Transcript_729/g.1130  ORF Transcript_729/g.1130 Transcript_729/m.1130 type:complete len:206 (-) Transcript_729:70-687(-)
MVLMLFRLLTRRRPPIAVFGLSNAFLRVLEGTPRALIDLASYWGESMIGSKVGCFCNNLFIFLGFLVVNGGDRSNCIFFFMINGDSGLDGIVVRCVWTPLGEVSCVFPFNNRWFILILSPLSLIIPSLIRRYLSMDVGVFFSFRFRDVKEFFVPKFPFPSTLPLENFSSIVKFPTVDGESGNTVRCANRFICLGLSFEDVPFFFL